MSEWITQDQERVQKAASTGNQRRERRSGAATKTSVEACDAIDIRTWAPKRQPLDTVWYVSLHCRLTEPGKYMDYKVQVVSTHPHYGGVRWYFMCPLTRAGCHCTHRVRKLYRPSGASYFACRHCWGLGYSSQRQDGTTRALRQVVAIRERLGGSSAVLEPFPAKPHGMWWKTYSRLRRSAEEWLAIAKSRAASERS